MTFGISAYSTCQHAKFCSRILNLLLLRPLRLCFLSFGSVLMTFCFQGNSLGGSSLGLGAKSLLIFQPVERNSRIPPQDTRELVQSADKTGYYFLI